MVYRRFIAGFVDFLLPCAPIYLGIYLALAFGVGTVDRARLELMSRFLPLAGPPVLLVVYLSFFTWRYGRTAIQGRLGMKVTSASGEPPGAARALLRSLLLYLPLLVVYRLADERLVLSTGGRAWAYVLALAWTAVDAALMLPAPHHALHDRLSGTQVVMTGRTEEPRGAESRRIVAGLGIMTGAMVALIGFMLALMMVFRIR